MSSFDYNAPAELFLAKPIKGSRTKYRRFATAAEALRYRRRSRTTKFVLLSYALVRFLDVLDAILKRFDFRWQ
jgi:hypothetical protein